MRNSLATRMLAGYVLFVLPLVVAGIVFDIAGRAMLEADIKAADAALARAIALETEARLRGAMRATEELARLSAVREVEQDVLQLVAESSMAARPDIDLFYILDAQGTMVFSVPRSPNTMGADFSFRKYFQDAIRSDEPVVSEGRISPTTGRPVATVAYRMLDERGDLRGVMATNLSLLELGKAAAAIEDARVNSGRGVRVSIVDASGQLLAHYDPNSLLSQASAAIPGLDMEAPLGSGVRVGWGPDGKEWLLSYAPVPDAGWTVVVHHSAAEAFASRRYFEMGLLGGLFFIAIGGCVFWFYLSRGVLAPLGALSAINRNAASWRDRGPREALGRDDEIGELAESLHRVQEEYGRRVEELSLLVETSRAAVSSLDTERVLDTVLDGLQQLLSVRACAVLGLEEAERQILIRASRGLEPDYAQKLRIKRDDAAYPVVRALESGSPVQSPDVNSESEFPVLASLGREAGFRSLLIVPLHTRRSRLVALVAYREDVHRFSPEEMKLVQHFGHHAAMAFENASLYESSLARERNRLEAIVQSMSHGLLLESPYGDIVYANRAASQILRVGAEEMVGSNITGLIQGLLPRTGNCPRDEREGAYSCQPGCGSEFELKDGGRHDIRVRCFEVAGEQDGRLGRGYLLQDVTHERELDRMRSSLVSTVAHELRTPLATIKGYASTLLQRDVTWDAESQRLFLQLIDDQTTALADLVANLLDLSRLEAGVLPLERDYCRLDDLVERTLGRLKAATARHRVVGHIPRELPFLLVDGRRVEQVIRNLVENAAKYSPAGARITLSAEARRTPALTPTLSQGEREIGFPPLPWGEGRGEGLIHQPAPGEILVTVSDEGPGIPAEHQGRVFEPFYQVDARLAREYGGAGLGLAICKGFVEAMGGRIWVESGPSGSSFSFTLPVAERVASSE